jgi:hypothetical protein
MVTVATDKGKRLLGWTGVEWGPLPYESTLSVLMRWVQLNDLGEGELTRLHVKRYWGTRHASYFEVSGALAGTLETAAVILQRPAEEANTMTGRAACLLNAMFSSTLRICPLCFESGYHSFWFQCVALPLCPVHAVPLTSRCQACGCPLPSVVDACSSWKPYRCNDCLSWISGAEFVPAMHHEFRDHARELQRKFDNLMAWANRLHLAHAEVGSAYAVVSRYWQWRGTLAYALCARLAPVLPQSLENSKHAVTILSWCLRRDGTQLFYGRRRTEERHYVDLVYRATLRMLAKWLLSRLLLFPERQCSIVWTDGLRLRLRSLDRHVAALHILRYFFDGGAAACRYALTDDLRHVYAGKEVQSLYGRCLTRLSVRAVTLCLYATILKILGRGKPLYWQSVLVELTESSTMASFGNEGCCRGFIAFESVTGMPLNPFQRRLS